METIIYGKEQGWMKEIIVYEASLTDAVLQELVADGLRIGEFSSQGCRRNRSGSIIWMTIL